LKGDVYIIQFHETKMGIEKLIPKEEKKDENC